MQNKKGDNCMKTFKYLLILTKPFGFPSVKGEFAKRAVAICLTITLVIFHGTEQIPYRKKKMSIFLTGCKARPARNFLIMSASELKSRLTYKRKGSNILLPSTRAFLWPCIELITCFFQKGTLFTKFKLALLWKKIS